MLLRALDRDRIGRVAWRNVDLAHAADAKRASTERMCFLHSRTINGPALSPRNYLKRTILSDETSDRIQGMICFLQNGPSCVMRNIVVGKTSSIRLRTMALCFYQDTVLRMSAYFGTWISPQARHLISLADPDARLL